MTDKIPYISKADLANLPETTRITAEAIPDSGSWWIATSDKDLIDVDNGNRRFLAIDPAWGADVQSWVEGIELEDGKLQFTNFGTGERKTVSHYHRLMEDLLAKSGPHQPMSISAPTGQACKTIHSMLYGKSGTVIIDECDPPLSDTNLYEGTKWVWPNDDDIKPTSLSAWGEKLWPTDYADIELRLLAQMENADDWKKLYLQEWPEPEAREPTAKEKKQNHRETYLRHNKVRGKNRDPHARRRCPF